MTHDLDTYTHKNPISIDELVALTGTTLGSTDWETINQRRIDGFADNTGDHQFIHVDPVRAAQSPLGGTIAHGFLVLSLLGAAAPRLLPPVHGTTMGLNYGLDRVRFLTPVPSGSRVRTTMALAAVEPRNDNTILTRVDATIELENNARPAVAAQWLNLLITTTND